jgi:hypothetical protein
MRVYFQIQYYMDDEEFGPRCGVHSDSCAPLDDLDIKESDDPTNREFYHQLLDEWLNHMRDEDPEMLKETGDPENILNDHHIIFSLCHCHHDD